MAGHAEEPPQKKQALTLPDLLRRSSPVVRPAFLAYVVGVLMVCILALAEVRNAEAWTDGLPLPESGILVPERQAVIPNPDGLRWIVFTQDAIRNGHPFRLPHWTCEDGLGEGRYVGWSSPPMWWLEALAYVRHLATGENILTSVANVSPYYCPVMWVFTAIFLGWLCVCAFGWRGGAIIPVLCAVLSPLSYSNRYSIFSPDHHLIILIGALGTLVCLSAPFVKDGKTNVRLWFVGAALFNTLGLWVSAPTQALVLIGLFAGFLFVPTAAVKNVRSSGWRLFGYLSSFLSLAVCFWEYRPDIPLYVETNNPLYAAGVLVAGIWFWQAHGFTASGRRFDALNSRALVYSFVLLVAAALPFFFYLPYLFSMADPYHIRWMSLLPEESPLNTGSFFRQYPLLWIAFFVSVYGAVTYRRERDPGVTALVVMAAGLSVAFAYFGIFRLRFLDHAILGMVVLVVMAVPHTRTRLAGWAIAAASMQWLLTLQGTVAQTRQVRVDGPPGMMLKFESVRDCSEHLKALMPEHPGRVLAPIEESNMLNFHAQCPVMGTGYWENNEALLETCRIFFDDSPPWTRAYSKIRRDGVGLIVVPRVFPISHRYVLFGNDPSYLPERSFAMYLCRVEPGQFLPWLNLEYEDASFRIFSVKER